MRSQVEPGDDVVACLGPARRQQNELVSTAARGILELVAPRVDKLGRDARDLERNREDAPRVFGAPAEVIIL